MEPQSVARHLRQVHDVPNEAAKIEADRIQSEAAARKSEANEELRDKYLDASDSTAPEPLQLLPVIPRLPVYSGWQCPGCSYIARSEKTLSKHAHECADDKQPTTAVATRVHCQTLFVGKKLRYFPVAAPESVDTALLDIISNLEGARPSEDVAEKDIRFLDPFLSQTRFDHHLQLRGLALENAFDLCSAEYTDNEKKLRTVLSDYIHSAFQVTQQKFFIRFHRFLDKSLSLGVESATRSRYEFRASRLLIFLTRACAQSSSATTSSSSLAVIPESVRKAVSELNVLCSRDIPGEQTVTILHNVLSTIFLSPLSEEQDVLPLFVSASAVFPSANQDLFRFGCASEVSPMLAALKYLLRAFVVREVYVGDDTATKCVRWDRVHAAADANADTGVTYLTHCLSLAMRLMNSESHHIRFIICREHTSCGILDGHELSLPTLGAHMMRIQEQAWLVLNDSLLAGLKLDSEFWTACSSLQDALCDRTAGYWLGTHPANIASASLWLHRYLEKIQGMYFSVDSSLKENEAKNFISVCDTLQQLLYVLLQVCSGAPARATEIGAVQVRNSATAARHVYVSKGQLFLVTSYHKSRALHEGVAKPISRFPDPTTSALFYAYLLLIKPVQVALIQKLFSSPDTPQPGSLCAEFLFTSGSKPATPDQLRSWFVKVTRSVDVPFTTSQYRQYHSGAVKHFLTPADSDASDSVIESVAALHRQAGHTESTAHRLYGVSDLDLKQLTASELDKYRTASESWHRALGLQRGLFLTSFSSAQPLPHPSSSSTSLPHNDPSNKVLLAHIMRLEKQILSLHSLLSSQHAPSPCPEKVTHKRVSMADSEHTPPPPVKKSKHSHLASRSPVSTSNDAALRALKEMLGNGNAEFRSDKQQEAVQTSLHGVQDALIVLPTAGGKSLVFQLPAFVHSARCSVVVVPLVALQSDIIRRCSALGISAVLWNDRHVADARLILASVEHLDTAEYKSFTLDKQRNASLHAIFIEEAHLVLLWDSFRDVLSKLHNLIRPPGVTCPVLALTATAPPQLSADIGTACGLREFVTVRAPTSRPNIRYSVKDTSDADLKLCVTEQVKSLSSSHLGRKAHFIVYTKTRLECELFATACAVMCDTVSVFFYHGGCRAAEKSEAYKSWLHIAEDKHALMVATSAFGSGIDVPTVRAIVHVGKPSNLLDYVQETGRAGRDGAVCDAVTINTSSCKEGDMSALIEKISEHQSTTDDENERRFGVPRGFHESSPTCRRFVPDEFIDGLQNPESCLEREVELCDVCSRSRQNTFTNTHTPVRCLTFGPRDISDSPLTAKASTSAPPFATAEMSSPTAPTSPSDLGMLITRYANNCPVCSIGSRKQVAHRGQACYTGKCLKCGGNGHRAANCTNIYSSDKPGCYMCSIQNIGGVGVHPPGSYGSKRCPVKRALSICIVAWEHTDLQALIMDSLPVTKTFTDTRMFADWLTGKTSPEPGVALVLPLISANVLC